MRELQGTFVGIGSANRQVAGLRLRRGRGLRAALLATTTLSGLVLAGPAARADVFNVNDHLSFANALRAMVLDRNDDHTINITGSFALSQDVAPIVLDDGRTLTVNGNGFTIDGVDSFRPFFVSSTSPTTAGGPTVTINNLNIVNGAGIGGNGGGGGMGAGGGLFVDQNTTVILDLVNFSGNSATGGNGLAGTQGIGGGGLGGDGGAFNNVVNDPSGGGGLYGNGGQGGADEGGGGGGGALGNGGNANDDGGGGGGGFFGNGGNGSSSDAGGGGGGLTADGSDAVVNTGGAGGGAEGGRGGDDVGGAASVGQPGQAFGGGGGGGGEDGGGGDGAFGGGGGGDGEDSFQNSTRAANGGYFGGGGGSEEFDGGNGGDFGGGGGGDFDSGGNGGFGGGGGGADGCGFLEGGDGGFGGGGACAGFAGFGGGDGGTNGGGGGAAFGGAIFVREGGTLTIRGSGTMGASTVTGGSGGNDGGDGMAAGGIFLQNATINFDPQTGETQTINDVIADDTGNGGNSGALLKSGDGTTTLTGDNTYTGDTTVTGGLLNVNGTNLSDAVVDGGALGGTGTVDDLFANNGGAVAPGNSIGTLNVAGNALFSPGSIFRVEVAANGTSDLLAVAGTTTINGGTVEVITLDPATSYVDGTVFTILTSTGGVTGQFDGVTDASAFLQFLLSSDANNIFLTLDQVAAFTAVAQTFNQQQVAAALENFLQTGDALALFNALLLLDPDEARAAFDLLSGEVHASALHAFFNTVRHLTGIAGERLWQLETGGGEGGSGGSQSTFMGLGLTSEALHGQMALGHGSAKDDEGPLRPRSSLAGWARGYGDVSRLDSDGNAAQAESTSGGLMGGVDTLVAPGTRIGLMAHWGRTDGDAEARLSNYDIETASIAAYGGIVIGNIHLKALAGYSSHDIETSRNIVFPGIARTATAGYDADQISLYGEAAYLMDMGHLALMPMIAVRWADVDVEGFTEQGAGAANLTVAAQSYDTLDTIVGLRIAGTYRSEGMTVMPQARIGWVHTSGDIAPLVPLTLAGGGGTFTVAGARRAEDALAVGVGVNVAFDDALTGFVDYGANLSDEATDQAVSAGFRWRF